MSSVDEAGNSLLYLSEYGSVYPVRVHHFGPQKYLCLPDVIMALWRNHIDYGTARTYVGKFTDDLMDALAGVDKSQYRDDKNLDEARSREFRRAVSKPPKTDRNKVRCYNDIWVKPEKTRVVRYPEGMTKLVEYLRERYPGQIISCGVATAQNIESRKRSRDDEDEMDALVLPPPVNFEALSKSPRFQDFVVSVLRLVNYEPLMVTGVKERDEQIKERAFYEDIIGELRIEKDKLVEKMDEASIFMETAPKAIEEKKRLINEGQRELYDLDDRCKVKATYLKELDAKIAEREKKIAEQGDKIKECETYMEQHKDKIAEMEKLKEDYDYELQSLSQIRKQRIKKEGALAALAKEVEEAKALVARLPTLRMDAKQLEYAMENHQRTIESLTDVVKQLEAKKTDKEAYVLRLEKRAGELLVPVNAHIVMAKAAKVLGEDQ